jgi:hypothetical protein
MLPRRAASVSLVFVLTACGSEGADDEDASSESAQAVGQARKMLCIASATSLWDRNEPIQDFEIKLTPGSAAEIDIYSTAETFTTTVTSPNGAVKSMVSTPSLDTPSRGFIANSWTENKTYRIRVQRSSAPQSAFKITCGRLVDADAPSGWMSGHAVCKVGQTCSKNQEGAKDGVCKPLRSVDLGDDYEGGFCQ